ncbi:MAG: hypothetical protein ABI609_18785 [Acidobacteriota bacterium]
MRAPRVWGFAFLPADLRAASHRRFLLKLTPVARPGRKPEAPAPIMAALFARVRKR